MQLLRNDCPREEDMNINLQLQPVVALIAGILILVAPRFVTWIIGIYLVIVGVLGLIGR
jgi:uncharacterized membrane protein HdeD (DUF308 family)